MVKLIRFSTAAFVSLMLAPVAATLMAHSQHGQVVMTDDCDPATFNAAVGPGACIGHGETTFQAFLAELAATRRVDDWEFDPDDVDNIATNGRVTAQNDGGETHSFTQVKKFGGGFVAPLNAPSGNPVPAPECARTVNGNLIPASSALATLVPAGHQIDSAPLAAGTHLFQCCIHPWMRTVVTVGGNY